MKKSVTTLTAILCSVFILLGQEPTISAKVNLDSVLLGNRVKLSITVENVANPQVALPDITGFDLLGGPNYASSMSMINGSVTQSVTYTYILEPKDIGQYFIGSVQVNTDDKVLETAPIEINVFHNPDGVIQQPRQQQELDNWFQWPQREITPKKKPKKKRKVYRL